MNSFSITKIIFERSFDTIRRNNFFYQFTEMYRNEAKALKVLHGFTNSVIEARRNELLTINNSTTEDNSGEGVGIKRKKALLDILLEASVDGAPLTNQDIREEVDTFMFRGHDTTTSGISFCFYNLAKYPQVQQKVYDEIQNEIGADDGALSLQHLSRLHYLELVIKESLRLFPSVPYYARKLSEEITVGGYTLPKKCSVYIAPYLMGRDANIFPNPLEFNPERFDVETTADKINPFAYVPFSAGKIVYVMTKILSNGLLSGPRNCIGQKFALCELKSIICKVLRKYEISIPKGKENLAVYSDLVLKSVDGVTLAIKTRN